MIRNIMADGPFVKIISDEDGEKWIFRRDALLRAKSIAGLGPTAPQLSEALILASAEAFKNEHGRYPDSTNLALFRKSVAEEHAKSVS